MAKRYGVPYGMSKNRIARRLVDFLPPADTFVDLFAGGCAVAHAALESHKYRRVIINDINPLPTQLFVDAVVGRYRDERRVIDRETFHRLKNSDPYVKYCWSFGSTGNNYIWSDDVAPVKVAACSLVMAASEKEKDRAKVEFAAAYKNYTGKEFPSDVLEYIAEAEDWQTRRIRYTRQLKKLGYREANELHGIENLIRLENLERLQGLENLERLVCDYRDVPIPENSVVYCDIPYERTSITKAMCDAFDYSAFYKWAIGQENIYISSYNLPENLFEGVRGWNRMQSMAAGGNSTKVLEKLFIPRVA